MEHNVKLHNPFETLTKKSLIKVNGEYLGDIFDDLNSQFPGFRDLIYGKYDYKIRPGLKVSVNGKYTENLDDRLPNNSEIVIHRIIAGG